MVWAQDKGGDYPHWQTFVSYVRSGHDRISSHWGGYKIWQASFSDVRSRHDKNLLLVWVQGMTDFLKQCVFTWENSFQLCEFCVQGLDQVFIVTFCRIYFLQKWGPQPESHRVAEGRDDAQFPGVWQGCEFTWKKTLPSGVSSHGNNLFQWSAHDVANILVLGIYIGKRKSCGLVW